MADRKPSLMRRSEPDAKKYRTIVADPPWEIRKVFREGDAARVARAWGFEPCGEIVWGLRNPGMGTPASANDHEPVLVAVRGSLPFTADRPRGVWFWRQLYANGGKVHSAKPEAFLDHVEQWSPGPYLELFARRARLGWDYWGNESLGTAEMRLDDAA